MKIKKLKLKISILALGLLILNSLIFNPKPVIADDFATGINPPLLLIEAEAPAKVSAPIAIENKSDKSVTYGIYLRPFKAGSQLNGVPEYDPKLIDEYEDFFKNVQIRVAGEDIAEINIPPRESKELELSISVNTDDPKTDRYFTVVFLTDEKDMESDSSIANTRGGIGTNVLLSTGPRNEASGSISKFSIPNFTGKGPVPITLEVTNSSNFYVSSEGNVIIKNMFGQIVGNLEFESLNILANSSRLVTNNQYPSPKLWWNEKYPIGIYTVEANIALSEYGPLLNQQIYFVAFPMQIALVIIIILMVLAWLFKRARIKASE